VGEHETKVRSGVQQVRAGFGLSTSRPVLASSLVVHPISHLRSRPSAPSSLLLMGFFLVAALCPPSFLSYVCLPLPFPSFFLCPFFSIPMLCFACFSSDPLFPFLLSPSAPSVVSLPLLVFFPRGGGDARAAVGAWALSLPLFFLRVVLASWMALHLRGSFPTQRRL